jgi:DNA-binding MarR family transcriptional regulator
LLSKIPGEVLNTQNSLSSSNGDLFPPERIRDLLHRKALATERHRAGVARRLGLSDTEVAALAHLARHGNLTPSQLADRLFLTSGGVTALAQRLERAGYVRREPHPRDKRSTVLSADPRILDEAGDLYEPLVSALDWATSELGTEERAAIGRYLERIVAISEEKADDVARAADDEAPLAGAPVPALWT